MINRSYDVTSEYFFKNHEKKQNELLFFLMRWLLIVIPFVILGKIFGKNFEIFSNVSYVYLLILYGIYAFGIFIASMIYLKKPHSVFIKYILLLTIEVLIFVMSLNSGFEVFISYALVPLISCIFINKDFTIRAFIFSYLTMVLSIWLRAFYVIPATYDKVTPEVWASVFTVGLTMEYALNAVLIYYITKRNEKLIIDDYNSFESQFKSFNMIVSSYVGIISQKDPNIEKHSKRTSHYVRIICRKLQDQKKYAKKLTRENCFAMISSALIHDIGIICNADDIFTKKETLTEEEKLRLRNHPVDGERLLRSNMNAIPANYFEITCDMVLYHHENWDGTGYPKGLKGEEIPLSARIMAVANTLDNLLSDRPYRESKSFDEAFVILTEAAGVTLDPEIVSIVLKSETEIWKFYNSL